jgi:hypothetical protein
MKKLFFTLALAFVANYSFSQSIVVVRGYVTTSGKYVETHHRTSPNNTVYDNWSTHPNINPYTGKIGTKTYNNYNIPSHQSTDFNKPHQLFKTNDLFKSNSLFN